MRHVSAPQIPSDPVSRPNLALLELLEHNVTPLHGGCVLLRCWLQSRKLKKQNFQKDLGICRELEIRRMDAHST